MPHPAIHVALSRYAMNRLRPVCRGLLAACVLSIPAPAMVGAQDSVATDDPTAADETAEKDEVTDPNADTDQPQNPFPNAVEVPSGILDGAAEWLNTSEPLSLKDLKGKIVLFDFWTYCCINCIHVIPDLKYLEEKYPDQLVVIGVHSAKFENEKVSENIRNAIMRYEIKHPVVNDNEMLIWRRFGTRAWPTLALIDPEGKYIGSQGGEGNRELFDTIISRLVTYHRANGTLDETPLVFDLEENHAQRTALRYPGKVLADATSDRLFISDSNHNRIVVTDLNGQLLDTIGSGRMGSSDGSYSDAEFDHPQGMAVSGSLLYVADTENHLIRVVDMDSRIVSTLAGTGSQGRPGMTRGPLKTTALNSPWALCPVDGTLYIAMAGPHQIWSHQIGSDEIGVYAGNAREDVVNGSLEQSSFAQPSGITTDQNGQFLYVVDSEGSSIRSVPTTSAGTVTTLAGTSELPRGQSLFAFGDIDAAGAEARFQHPLGIAWKDGILYIADSYNHKIRKLDVASGEVTTWLGTGKPGDALEPAQLSEPAGLSIANDKLYIADTNNHRICVADLQTGTLSALSISGLSAPIPTAKRSLPDLTSAVSLETQLVAPSQDMSVIVQLNVPADYKLNNLAPVVWEAFYLDGNEVIGPTALEGRDEAVVDGNTATFRLPIAAEGSGTIAVHVSYGFCSEGNAGICRLAQATWKIPVTVSEDSEVKRISLPFPDPLRVLGAAVGSP